MTMTWLAECPKTLSPTCLFCQKSLGELDDKRDKLHYVLPTDRARLNLTQCRLELTKVLQLEILIQNCRPARFMT